METACEPWNDSYDGDGAAECLLRRLESAGPRTRDEVMRDCLRDDEIRPLLDPQQNARWQREMISGLASFVVSFGKSSAFSDAIRTSSEEIEMARRSRDWSHVPLELRELAGRRADFILTFARDEGLVEQDASAERWRITERGKSLLAGGGFYMK